MAKNKNTQLKLEVGQVLDLPNWAIATDWRLNASRDQLVAPPAEELDDIVNLMATRQVGWDTSYVCHVMPDLPPSDVRDSLPSFAEIGQARRDALAELKAKSESEPAAHAAFIAAKADWCDESGNVPDPIVWNNDCFRRNTARRRANEIRFRNGLPLITKIQSRVVSYASELDRMEANAAENTIGTAGRRDIGLGGLMMLAYRMSCDPDVSPVNFRVGKTEDGKPQESIFGSKGQCFDLVMRIYKVVKPYALGQMPYWKRFSLKKDDPLFLEWKRFNATNLGALAKEVSGLNGEAFEARLQEIHTGSGKDPKTSMLKVDVLEGFAKIDNQATHRVLEAVIKGDASIRGYIEATRHVFNVCDSAYAIGQLKRLQDVLNMIAPMIANDKQFNELVETLKSVKV